MQAAMRAPWTIPTAVIAALALAGCEASVSIDRSLNTGRAERVLKAGILAQTPVAVAAVDCPSDVSAKKGVRFTCTARGADGSKAPVAVVVTDSKGNVRWNADLVDQTRVESAITGLVKRRMGVTGGTVDCPDVVELRARGRYSCALRAPDGSTATAKVTLEDDTGRFSLRVVGG